MPCGLARRLRRSGEAAAPKRGPLGRAGHVGRPAGPAPAHAGLPGQRRREVSDFMNLLSR
jgi:hypothetical protein